MLSTAYTSTFSKLLLQRLVSLGVRSLSKNIKYDLTTAVVVRSLKYL